MPEKPAAKTEEPGGTGSSLAAAGASEDRLDLGFLEKVAPVIRRLRSYSRLRVDGLDHVPEEGPAILACNHTGWLGLDAAFTMLSVYEALERMPRAMAHAAWFGNAATRDLASRMGIFKVSKDAMEQQLGKGHLVLIFPEGEKGAFRPGSDYTLEAFARGFVRVAMKTHVPVIPVAILGGEEANPVGSRIESYEELINMKGGLPIPKNLIPRPVKWRIRFLPPIAFEGYSDEDAADKDLVHSLSEHVRARVQRELRKMKVERGNPYL